MMIADHREAFAKGQRTGRRGMSEVVNSYLFEPGPLADAHHGLCRSVRCKPGSRVFHGALGDSGYDEIPCA